MQFPKSRTEVLDTVAGIVAKSLDQHDEFTQEAKKSARLALMFWNDVEDKSLPQELYEGLDIDLMEATNPARSFDDLDFVSGAVQYQSDRYEALQDELNRIENVIHNEISKDSPFADIGENKIHDHCDMVLGSSFSRQAVINSMRDLGYAVMDRKLTFDIDNFNQSFDKIGLSAPEILSHLKNELESEGISDSVDVRARIHYPREGSDDAVMRIEAWHNSDNSVTVQDLVIDMMKEKSKVYDMQDVSMVLQSEYIGAELPGFKDYADFRKRERAQRDLEAKKEFTMPEMTF